MDLNRERNGATFTINGINLADISSDTNNHRNAYIQHLLANSPLPLSGFDIFSLFPHRDFMPLTIGERVKLSEIYRGTMLIYGSHSILSQNQGSTLPI
jgi:hypothetical protein